MPRRTVTPATPAPAPPLPPPPRDPAILAESDPQWAANLTALRRNWKWANFSQFFYTFAPLLAMPDVFLADVEDDLARGTNLYLPRIMHRLLYTLSQDRKISIDNWQTALRKQYLRRAPELNPIGPEPKLPSRESSIAPYETAHHEDPNAIPDDESKPTQDAQVAIDQSSEDKEERTSEQPKEASAQPKSEPPEDGKVPAKASSEQRLKTEEQEESKDWLDLPMLAKLDSLHLLTEWQFHNPYKLRQIMKDDDEAANWRIEPIGYDAKTNAYWLIGPDRLWIQRVPPKPPRSRNLKRKRPVPAAKKAPAQASSSKVDVEPSDDDDGEEPVPRSKRTRTQPQSQAQSNGRSTRASRRQTRASSPAPADELSSPGKSARAAKVQANKKLDLQARELAEYQRQLAAAAKSKAAAASPRSARRGAPASPATRAVGTRISARLRRSTRGAPEDEDEEWQQVPDEWLQEQESASPVRRSTRARVKGKSRTVENEEEPEEDPDADVDADGEAELDGKETADAAAGGEDGEAHELLQRAGLEGDSVSELTDLSAEEEEDVLMADASPKKRKARTRKSTAGSQRAGRLTQRKDKPAAKKKPPPAKDGEADADEQQNDAEQADEPPAPPLPEDFIEWEAIAVTLPEWEHVADRFANATHYLEKALYKTLTQNIVPFVTAELREHEKRRRLEEAIVHRKRSSRIAMKETEKEEARLAAKRRAEEEEKMARARRQEARLKKEEEERAKRERAREQRRKEREEREARIARARERAQRNEHDDNKDDDTSAARSTATPTVTGTHASSSVQPSRVVTPNGVRSPDWVLDCEICHKQGVNVDDGLAMVSCGSCNRWQHIPCHDLNDQRFGRPRRNWEEQQFYCSRCRQRPTNGTAYGTQGYPAPSQYSWSQAARAAAPAHKSPTMDTYAPTSDVRYPHQNGMVYPAQQQQQYGVNYVGAASYSRSSYPDHGLSFSHYQPDQRGMAARGAGTHSSSHSGTYTNGYAPPAEHMNGRMSSTQFAPQYTHNGSLYSSHRLPSNYQTSSSTAPSYSTPDTIGTMSAARWPSQPSTTTGYHSSPTTSSVQTAAESLAYMHDSSSRYSGSSTWPQQMYSHGQQPQPSMSSFARTVHSSQHAHARSAYPQGQAVDPLAGPTYPAPRPEQHVGSSLPAAGSASFTFPS